MENPILDYFLYNNRFGLYNVASRLVIKLCVNNTVTLQLNKKRYMPDQVEQDATRILEKVDSVIELIETHYEAIPDTFIIENMDKFLHNENFEMTLDFMIEKISTVI